MIMNNKKLTLGCYSIRGSTSAHMSEVIDFFSIPSG